MRKAASAGGLIHFRNSYLKATLSGSFSSNHCLGVHVGEHLDGAAVANLLGSVDVDKDGYGENPVARRAGLLADRRKGAGPLPGRRSGR